MIACAAATLTELSNRSVQPDHSDSSEFQTVIIEHGERVLQFLDLLAIE